MVLNDAARPQIPLLPPGAVSGARLTKGYYQLIEAANGEAMFLLRAGNHEAILRSRVFRNRQAAVEGVVWLREVGNDRNRFLRRESADGRPCFAILGTDGQELAHSEPYAGRSGVDTGIASVMRNCGTQEFRGLVRWMTLSV